MYLYENLQCVQCSWVSEVLMLFHRDVFSLFIVTECRAFEFHLPLGLFCNSVVLFRFVFIHSIY